MTPHRILIFGLPGTGKTTLSGIIAAQLRAVHFNADTVRQTINAHLGFSRADRIQQAATMRQLCDMANASGISAVADFVCPTIAARAAFGPATKTIWMNTPPVRDYPDTTAVFTPPTDPDFTVSTWREIPALLRAFTTTKRGHYVT